jgi:hypothetical protein
MKTASIIGRPDAAILRRLPDVAIDAATRAAVERLAIELAGWRGRAAHHRLPPALVAAEAGWRARSKRDAQAALLALLFRLAQGFEAAFAASGLPEATRPYFHDAFARMADYWPAQDDALRLTNNAFVKDLSIAALRLVPAAARVVDPCGAFPLGFLPTLGAAAPRAAAYLARDCRGTRPLVALHVHDLAVDYFSREGFVECLGVCAALLAADPRLKGVVGSSWFYDPRLGAVSPKLAYLHELPAAHGAFFARGRTDAETVSLALRRSPSRRAAHAAGRYQPQRWWLIWSRRRLLAAIDAL